MDLIERQAAIDELGYCQTYLFDSRDKDKKISLEDAEYAIEQLPSAESEIVRCKDCKHYGCVLYSATQFEYGECFGHEESHYTFEVKPDDFCSRAERRTE